MVYLIFLPQKNQNQNQQKKPTSNPAVSNKYLSFLFWNKLGGILVSYEINMLLYSVLC